MAKNLNKKFNPLSMEIYICVMMWGGLIEEVKAFTTKDAAERYRTAENAEFKELLDFEGVKVFGVELE